LTLKTAYRAPLKMKPASSLKQNTLAPLIQSGRQPFKLNGIGIFRIKLKEISTEEMPRGQPSLRKIRSN
jgi:hypothetical protein